MRGGRRGFSRSKGFLSERGTHRAGEARGEELGVRRELRHVRDIPSERDAGKVMLQDLRERYGASSGAALTL